MAYMGILPEATSASTQLARGLGGGIGSGLTNAVQFAEKMALQKAKSQSLSKATKQLEKEKAIDTGLRTIEDMRKLISSAGPSNAVQSFLGLGEARKNRADLESMGLSLIPLRAAGVSVRNQKEFDKYSSVITNPNSRQDDLEGALNGLERVLKNSMEERSEEEHPAGKKKFSPEHPEHRKKAEQLFKTYKDKEKVREALSREFEL